MGALQAIVLLLAGGLLGFTWGRRGRGPGPAPMSVRHVPHRRRRWTRSVVRLARMQAADLDAALMQLSQTAAHAVGVDRASVWQVQPDQQTIICKEMYFRDSGRHVAGIVVPLAHVSRYLAALDADRTLAIADVAHDERCRELQAAYLAPHAIRSMLDVPIRFRGRLVGILCHESTRSTRTWTADEREMAATLGDLAALTWEGFAHMQAESDLRQRHQELQVAQDRMDAALAAMAEGMLITDAGDRILRCNVAAATLLGRPCGELPGTPVADVIALPPGRTALRDLLITFDRPIGAIRQLRANRSPVSDSGCVITLRDVTAEEEVSRLKTDFVAIASHELRTPLTIIQGYVGLLMMGEERGMAPGRRQEILTSLRLHCDRLSRLIRDVLNVARLDADALPAQPESVDVTRVIAETLDLLGPQAHRKGIRLLARYGTQPLPAVWADSGHLLQILSNLVENAVKYSPPDRQVLIEALPTDHMLRISVSDQGIGIPAEEQEQIFSRFHRVATPTMLKERGSGLGLYIARRLAEAQGGTLLVSSLPGTGSTFAVTIPLARTLNPPAEQAG